MMMKNYSRKAGFKKIMAFVCSTVLGGALSASPAFADTPKVVVSILPVHSLVQSVMDGVGEPELLVDQGASPHGYSLKPSQVRALNNADLVVWVGESLETFLEKPLSQKKQETKVLELMDLEGISLLENRTEKSWETDHLKHGDQEEHAEHHDEEDGHGSDHDEGHNHSPEHDHDDHDEHASDLAHDNGHDHDQGHDHGKFDPHLWLSIENAKTIVRKVGVELAVIDPDHAQAYQENVELTLASLDLLQQEITGRLSQVKGKPYLVFHDAYQYFEKEFALNSVGAVTINPERKPGAKRVFELRAHIKDSGAVCIFSEPQFKPAIVDVLSEGLPIKKAELDPMGSHLGADKGAYRGLMTALSQSIETCLTK